MFKFGTKRIVGFLIILVIILGISSIEAIWDARPFSNAALTIQKPFVGGISSATQAIARPIRSFFEIPQNINLNTKLNIATEQINSLQAQISQLKEENIQLRTVSNIALAPERSKVLADAIGFVQDLNTGMIIINKGSRDRIEQNLPVYSPDGSAIGKVTQVNHSTSQIRTITDPSSTVAAFVPDISTDGVLTYNPSIGVFIDLIPLDHELIVGQSVITSGLDEIFPRGSSLGTISSIIAESSDTTQKAVVDIANSPQHLSHVLVLLNENI